MTPEQTCAVCRSNMRARRLELGLTQQELGDLVGLPGSAISVIESGKRSPELRTMAKIATALKTTLSALSSADSFSLAAS